MEDKKPAGKRFNPSEHLIQLKGKDYLPVAWRVCWFRERYPQGVIETEMVHLDPDREVEAEAMVFNPEKRRSEKVIKQARGFVIFKAVVKDGQGGIATGTKSENAANFADYVEKCETGSIGRALAALGFGTQFTGDEFDEGERIVDSPVERTTQNGTSPRPQSTTTSPVAAAAPSADSQATAQQLSSIRKLVAHLEQAEPDGLGTMTYGQAQKAISELSQKYRDRKKTA